MAIAFKNYSVQCELDELTSPPTSVEKVVLIGKAGGTVIKSLELISGSESSIVEIIRRDVDDNDYATIRLGLKANDYLVLWEGFFVIPLGHRLIVAGDSNQVRAVVNVAEIT